IGERVQQNVALTSSVKTGRKTWILLGGHLGRSDRGSETDPRDVMPADGYQVDVGLLGRIDKQLTWQIMLNEERREIVNEGDDVVGGFVHDGGTRRTLRRMAFGLHYLLGGHG